MENDFKKDVLEALINNKRWCCVCNYAEKFDLAPGLSSKIDGVYCSNRKKVQEWNDGIVEKVNGKKTVNLWRYEILDRDGGCEHFRKMNFNKLMKRVIGNG